jgi:hypothetical protein
LYSLKPIVDDGCQTQKLQNLLLVCVRGWGVVEKLIKPDVVCGSQVSGNLDLEDGWIGTGKFPVEKANS